MEKLRSRQGRGRRPESTVPAPSSRFEAPAGPPANSEPSARRLESSPNRLDRRARHPSRRDSGPRAVRPTSRRVTPTDCAGPSARFGKTGPEIPVGGRRPRTALVLTGQAGMRSWTLRVLFRGESKTTRKDEGDAVPTRSLGSRGDIETKRNPNARTFRPKGPLMVDETDADGSAGGGVPRGLCAGSRPRSPR